MRYQFKINLPQEFSSWLQVLEGEGYFEFKDSHSLVYQIESDDMWDLATRMADIRNNMNAYAYTDVFEKPKEI